MTMPIVRKLFVTGGSLDIQFLKTFIVKAGKSSPKLVFVPTAVGDRADIIEIFTERCSTIGIVPYVLRTFISSYQQKETFESILSDADIVVVYGGNTLNMLAIWKAQGIDILLKQAYERGTLMAGGSAGSLCWFEEGTTDSRPVNVTKIECLGWIKGSHCPHYHAEAERKPMYHESILSGVLKPGYALDDYAGLYFENEKAVETCSLVDGNSVFYVNVVDKIIRETKIKLPEISNI